MSFPPGWPMMTPEMMAEFAKQQQEGGSSADPNAAAMMMAMQMGMGGMMDPAAMQAQMEKLREEQLRASMEAQGLLPVADAHEAAAADERDAEEKDRSGAQNAAGSNRPPRGSPRNGNDTQGGAAAPDGTSPPLCKVVKEDGVSSDVIKASKMFSFGDVYNPRPVQSKRPYPLPQNINPEDWECPNQACRNINFKKRSRCNMCNTHKDDRSGGDAGNAATPTKPGSGDDAVQPNGIFKQGDWTCASCANVNWVWRERCNVCNNLKPNLQEPRGGGKGGGYFDRGAVEKNEWQSDDEEIDEFGRRKNKRGKSTHEEALQRLYKRKKHLNPDEQLAEEESRKKRLEEEERLKREEEDNDDGDIPAWMKDAEEEENSDKIPDWMKEAEAAEEAEEDDDIPAWMKEDQDQKGTGDGETDAKDGSAPKEPSSATQNPDGESTLTSSEQLA